MPPSHQWLSISPTPFGISTSSRLHWPSASSQALASLIPGMICWKRPHTSTGNGRSGGNLPASTNPRQADEQSGGMIEGVTPTESTGVYPAHVLMPLPVGARHRLAEAGGWVC